MRIVVSSVVVAFMAGTAAAANVATVNGKGFTEEKFQDAVESLGNNATMVAQNPEMRERFLNHLIDTELKANKAKDEKLQKTERYEQMLKQAKGQILATLYTDSYVAKNTTDKALKEYFNANKSKFSDEKYKAAHILIKDEKKAKDILAKALKKGADFAKLAKDNSEGPSANKGGDLGEFGPGQMVPEFEKAVKETKANTIHPNLVKTQFGFHIIKVGEKTGSAEPKFADVKGKVLEERKESARRELDEKVRSAAKIEIHKDVLEKVKL